MAWPSRCRATLGWLAQVRSRRCNDVGTLVVLWPPAVHSHSVCRISDSSLASTAVALCGPVRLSRRHCFRGSLSPAVLGSWRRHGAAGSCCSAGVASPLERHAGRCFTPRTVPGIAHCLSWFVVQSRRLGRCWSHRCFHHRGLYSAGWRWTVVTLDCPLYHIFRRFSAPVFWLYCWPSVAVFTSVSSSVFTRRCARRSGGLSPVSLTAVLGQKFGLSRPGLSAAVFCRFSGCCSSVSRRLGAWPAVAAVSRLDGCVCSLCLRHGHSPRQ